MWFSEKESRDQALEGLGFCFELAPIILTKNTHSGSGDLQNLPLRRTLNDLT